MRADPRTAAAPILFLTAGDDLVLKQLPDYQGRGAELLPKPFDVSTLLDLVERMLREANDVRGRSEQQMRRRRGGWAEP